MRDSRAWKAAWPLLLCAASAGVTLACVRMSDSNREKHMEKVTIEHVHVETEKPFAEVAAALEARMGKFDPAVYEELRSGADPEAVSSPSPAGRGGRAARRRPRDPTPGSCRRGSPTPAVSRPG